MAGYMLHHFGVPLHDGSTLSPEPVDPDQPARGRQFDDYMRAHFPTRTSESERRASRPGAVLDPGLRGPRTASRARCSRCRSGERPRASGPEREQIGRGLMAPRAPRPKSPAFAGLGATAGAGADSPSAVALTATGQCRVLSRARKDPQRLESLQATFPPSGPWRAGKSSPRSAGASVLTLGR